MKIMTAVACTAKNVPVGRTAPVVVKTESHALAKANVIAMKIANVAVMTKRFAPVMMKRTGI